MLSVLRHMHCTPILHSLCRSCMWKASAMPKHYMSGMDRTRGPSWLGKYKLSL